ncbi:MAG: DNA-binding protein [Deltaproteobacteria bacterium]|nr:DNA-binding protein [Deltaproteobacteria bacterium]
MIRLFLDANVLFTAAHNPHGKAALIIELSGAKWEVATSAYCVMEARHNLERKYPKCSGRMDEILGKIRIVPDVIGDRCPIPLPEKDRPVYAAAVRCRAGRFLTGNRRHFGPFMNEPERTTGMTVQTVGDFLKEISR